MKLNPKVSKSRRVSRKAHFRATGKDRLRRMHSHVAKSLRNEYGVRAINAVPGDVVCVKGGKYDKKEGAVTSVSDNEYKVYVEGCFVTKNDGTPAMVPIHPSKLTIVKFGSQDEKRVEFLEEKKQRRSQVTA